MERPSFQFYPGDWLNDVALRVCSVEARGLWIDMLCIMHQSNPYGFLLINGQKMDEKSLKKVSGMDQKRLKKCLKILEDNGVFSRDENGVIFSRRMVKDEHIRTIRAEAGSKGGQASSSKYLSFCSSNCSSKKSNNVPPPSSSSSSSSSSSKKKNTYSEDAQKVLDYLNQKTGKRYTKKDEIVHRLLEGKTIEQCIQIIDTKIHDPFFLKDNMKLMNPVTLFRKSHFDIYLNQKPEDFHDEQTGNRYSAERLKRIAIEKGLYREDDNGR